MSDLASLPWLGRGPSFAELPAARWLLRHARGVEPIARSDRLTVQIAMVRAGVGVVLVPRPSLAHYALAAVTLSRALRSAEAELPSNELYLVTHRALRDVPRVRVVWDLIANRLGPRPARTVRPPRGGRAVDER